MASTVTKTNDLQYPVHYRWDLARFEHAIKTGVFDEDDRIELISGELVETMSPQNDPHADVVVFLNDALSDIFRPTFSVRVQLPLALSVDSRPEPDLAIVTGSSRSNSGKKYKQAVLIVEVSDTTLRFDRTTKASLYASAKIAEYWIVNLSDRCIEVHLAPELSSKSDFGFVYSKVVRYGENETLSSLAMPGKTIVVGDILP